MQKEFSKLLKKTLLLKLGNNWELYTQKSIYIFPGEIVFRIPSNSPKSSGYLIIVPDHHGRNIFTIDLGWSVLMRFPQLPRRPYGQASQDRSEFTHDEFTCRLSSIWGEGDYWWNEKENMNISINDAIDSLSSDAIQKINDFGIPYLIECFKVKNETVET